MMRVIAMILAGGKGRRLCPLTENRAVAAAPFGGKAPESGGKEEAMEERCPFCWDKNIARVHLRRAPDPAETEERLMHCSDCEKWYWADSGREVSRLFMICETSILHSEKCFREVRDILNTGFNSFSPRRLPEFNHLCAQCPSRNLKRFRILSSRQKPASLVPLKLDPQPGPLALQKI
jgi:hypothetical protein